MAKLDTQSTVTLVINGQQAATSLRDITRALNEVRATRANMNQEENPARYQELIRQEQALAAAQRERRDETNKGAEAQKGFFADFKKGFSEIEEMAGRITAGTLIYKGVSAIIEGIKSVWDGAEEAFNESAKSQAQLDAALKSTQSIAGETKKALNDLAKAEMDKTAIDDDVINKGEEMLLTFSNIRGKIYEQAVPAIVDMTSALNQGNVSMETIQQTSILVGKALQDPIAGMTALKRVGVTLDDQQKASIKTLVESNRLQDAQAIILKELQKEFGNTAETVANSEAGPMMRFNTRIGNIQESLGQWIVKGKSLAVDVLNPLLGWIEDFLATPLSEKLHEDQASLLGLRVELESTNTTTERRHKLIEDLKAQYPGYLSQVDSDKVKNSELLPILEKINQAFVLRIAYQTRAEKLDKAIKEEADAINETYDQKQKLIMRIGEIQQMVAEDGIKFNIKGSTEEEKALYIRKNLVDAIRDQAKSNTDLNNVLASNKYDNLISGLNVYGNSLVSTTKKQKDSHDQVKQMTDDLTKFKQASGYNDVIPGADLLDTLSTKVKTLNAVLETTKKGTETYKKMVDVLKEANQELKNGPNDPSVLKSVPGTIDKIDSLTGPQSGKSAATLAKEERERELAAKRLQEYNKQLQEMRDSMNQLAEGARKGTIDDLDAQLKVIEDKYRKVVDNINKLLKDPHTTAAIRKELTGRLAAIPDEEKLNKTNTTNDFNKKQDDQLVKDNDEGLKNSSKRVDDIYAGGQSQLLDSQEGQLNSVQGDSPASVEAQRFNIKSIYAKKEFELEQKHLEDLKSLNQTYGKDTAAIDKKISDNTIKENDRAAKEKLEKDKAYKTAKDELSKMERDTIQQGAQFLESILDKRSALYAAALIVDKAVAVANIAISTESSIMKYKDSLAWLGPAGLPMVTAYTVMSRIQEGIAIASIAAQTISQLNGSSGKKAKQGALIPSGPSHDDGGIDLVNNKTGERIAEMEGGEPIMILSKDTYANNKMLVNELLYNSQYRNGAPVSVNSGLAIRAMQQFRTGGMVQQPAIINQAPPTIVPGAPVDMSQTNQLLSELTEHFKTFSQKPWDFNYRAFEIFKNQVDTFRNNANAKKS